MTMTSEQCLDILLEKSGNTWVSKEIRYDDISKILSDLPTKAGIYQIKTTTPLSLLSMYSEREDKAHYNFKKKIQESLQLKNFIIQENVQKGYIVYTGHQKSLRQRCREHFKGSRGTGCLNIFEFKELREYQWWFEYIEIASFPYLKDSKLIRTYLEQLHRANIGWPVLCSQ